MAADSRRVGCLGMTDTVEAESSSGSESNSPRHPDSGAEQEESNGKRAKSGSGKQARKRATHVPSAFADEQGQPCHWCIPKLHQIRIRKCAPKAVTPLFASVRREVLIYCGCLLA